MPRLRRQLIGRVTGNLATARMLFRAGVRPWSIAAYPLRRRTGDILLVFRNGATLVAPRGEPLLNLVREIWVENRYALPPMAADEVVLDIGAHVGTFAVWASYKCPGARIISVEPSPVTLDYLRRNVAENRLKNVTVVEAACAADDGERQLFTRGVLAMNTLFAPRAGSVGTAVKCVTLDQLFARFAIPRCAFLKLDCEGAEYQILFSTSDEVLSRIACIAMEYHRSLAPYDEDAISTFLHERSFEVTVGPLEDEEGGFLYAWRPELRAAGPVIA